MKKTLHVTAIAIAFIVMCATASEAFYYHAYGSVEIPGGEPVAGIMVQIYYEGEFSHCVWTDDYGVWETYFYNCGAFVTASIGAPTKGNSQKASNVISCSGSTVFATITLECGGPRQPPCPRQ